MATSDRELAIENKMVELAKLLDEEYGVDDEFYSVIVDAVGRHAELIEEQEA